MSILPKMTCVLNAPMPTADCDAESLEKMLMFSKGKLYKLALDGQYRIMHF